MFLVVSVEDYRPTARWTVERGRNGRDELVMRWTVVRDAEPQATQPRARAA